MVTVKAVINDTAESTVGHVERCQWNDWLDAVWVVMVWDPAEYGEEMLPGKKIVLGNCCAIRKKHGRFTRSSTYPERDLCREPKWAGIKTGAS